MFWCPNGEPQLSGDLSHTCLDIIAHGRNRITQFVWNFVRPSYRFFDIFPASNGIHENTWDGEQADFEAADREKMWSTNASLVL